MYIGNREMSQWLMRARVACQGITLGFVFYSAYQKDNMQEYLSNNIFLPHFFDYTLL